MRVQKALSEWRALFFRTHALWQKQTAKSNLIIICKNVHVESASEWVAIGDYAQHVPEIGVLSSRIATLVGVGGDAGVLELFLALNHTRAELAMLKIWWKLLIIYIFVLFTKYNSVNKHINPTRETSMELNTKENKTGMIYFVSTNTTYLRCNFLTGI